jgi:hypothetical protein
MAGVRPPPTASTLLALVVVACGPSSASTSPTPGGAASPAPPTPGAPSPSGLAASPHPIVGPLRLWYLLPDAAFREDARVVVTFPDGDPSAGRPRARLRSSGRVVDLARSPDVPASWAAALPLDDAPTGRQIVEILVRLRSGEDVVVGTREFTLSAPEYVVWTLDFEGDAAGDAETANTAAIADGLGVPMTVMWNPRVWTTSQVTPARADAMLTWTKGRLAKGDEVALHVHMWTDFVRAAGLVPRTAPNWAGRSDGYDVPLTAYDEAETRTLVEYSLRLMAEHGLPTPTSFRGGGLFANAANLRAVSALGFTADCSSTPAGPFGRLQLPWTLAADAQPYYPARDDANRTGDLPLLEAPTIGGNTYGQSVSSIAAVAQADLRMIAAPGQPAEKKRALTVVSHPGTIDATERAAIESLFRAFEPYRYDRDAGPLRFVTLAQLAKAYSR